VRPTRWTTVVGLVLLAGVVGWLVPDRAYGRLSSLPAYAPLTALVIALFELGLARVVWRKIRHRGSGTPMHPLQVARAAALAKASSSAGSMLLGFYAGFFTWVAPHDEIRAAAHDTWVTGWSAVASALLLLAGLLLERACRTPPPPD
jgi:hypothetical protein